MVGSLLVVAQDEEGQNPFEAADEQLTAILCNLSSCKIEVSAVLEDLKTPEAEGIKQRVKKNNMDVDRRGSLTTVRRNLEYCKTILSEDSDSAFWRSHKPLCLDAIRVFGLYGMDTENDKIVSIAEKMRAIVDPLS
jgi:ribosomal protein L29